MFGKSYFIFFRQVHTHSRCFKKDLQANQRGFWEKRENSRKEIGKKVKSFNIPPLVHFNIFPKYDLKTFPGTEIIPPVPSKILPQFASPSQFHPFYTEVPSNDHCPVPPSYFPELSQFLRISLPVWDNLPSSFLVS